MILAPLLLLFQVASDVPLAPLPIPSRKHATVEAPPEAAPPEAAPPAATPEARPEPPTFDEARLEDCIAEASKDPATAITRASQWAGEAAGEVLAYPQQCLGHAYTSLLRWDAAERAFLTARDALPEERHEWRARLALQAGNAALAGDRADAALFDFSLADGDLAANRSESDPGLAAMIETDRARALVAQDKQTEAEPVLAKARALDPQSPNTWLLSATLARRLGKLSEAQSYIDTAAKLAPKYPEIGLEAGVIEMLAGDPAAARESWQSVIALAPGEDAATSAKAYLAQLDELKK